MLLNSKLLAIFSGQSQKFALNLINVIQIVEIFQILARSLNKRLIFVRNGHPTWMSQMDNIQQNPDAVQKGL